MDGAFTSRPEAPVSHILLRTAEGSGFNLQATPACSAPGDFAGVWCKRAWAWLFGRVAAADGLAAEPPTNRGTHDFLTNPFDLVLLLDR